MRGLNHLLSHALVLALGIHGDIAERSQGKLMDGIIALWGINLSGSELLQPSSQASSLAELDA